MNLDWTARLQREVERAGDEPVRLVHPVTHEQYVVLRAKVYERMCRLLQAEAVDPSFYEFGEKEPAAGH